MEEEHVALIAAADGGAAADVRGIDPPAYQEPAHVPGYARRHHHPGKAAAAVSGTVVRSAFWHLLHLWRPDRSMASAAAILLSGMTVLTFLFLGESRTASSMALQRGRIDRRSWHGSSFGGANNLGHLGPGRGGAGAVATDRISVAALIEQHEPLVPVSATDGAVPSLSSRNILNLRGHYVHDEHWSPYASYLYDRPREELDAEQEEYVAKMAAVREEWGAWDFSDPGLDLYSARGGRPVTSFDGSPYKDLPAGDFVEGSWQTDGDYVREFISEAKQLTHRVREAIYAEYGHPAHLKDRPPLTSEELKERDEMFHLVTEGFHLCKGQPTAEGDPCMGRKSKPMPGIGYWRQEAIDALSKKLLHAMHTSDEFYVVLGGHSSAAGHGNNFFQTKMMEFHHIMEPVFAHLGMRLVSRNMAQGGVGTTNSAMGGADIYGESDIMIWDSAMTEREAGLHDLFNRQAILSGERVPVLFMPIDNMHDIEEQSDGAYSWGGGRTNAFHDDFEQGVLERTQDEEQVEGLPFAVRYMLCGDRGDLCNEHKYNSVCWAPRSDDANPSPDRKIDPFVSGRANWHPGWATHRWEARKWTLIVLHSLDQALDTWSEGIKMGGLPLADVFWHVGDVPGGYSDIRKKLREHIPADEDGLSECEKHFKTFPIVCKVAMHSFSEWTPRIRPDETSLISILKGGPNGYHPEMKKVNEYDGFDILPLEWKIPEGEVDVHAVAIATTRPPPDLEGEKTTTLLGLNRALLNSARTTPDGNERAAGVGSLNIEQRDAVRRLQSKASRYGIYEKLEPLPILPKTRRQLQDRQGEAIIPGLGWAYLGGKSGFCDGSFQSECGRDKDSKCPFSGHNDGRQGIFGDALSGWLVFTVPNVNDGVILLRLEAWHEEKNKRTESWTEVNNTTASIGCKGRRLDVPEDILFDYAVDGEIKSMGYEEYKSLKNNIVAANMALWPIILDKDRPKVASGSNDDAKTIEVAIRLRSSAKRDAVVLVSHLFYA